MAGNGTAYEEQISLEIDANDFEVLGRRPLVAHLAGHLHALDDLAGAGACADRSGVAEGFVGTMGSSLDLEAMALDDARESAALARPDGIDQLAGLEDIHLDFCTRLEFGRLLSGQARFGEISLGRAAAVLFEMGRLGLGEEIRAAISKGELDRVVAVFLGRLLLDDRIRTGFEHGHWNGHTGVGKDLGHTELLAK